MILIFSVYKAKSAISEGNGRFKQFKQFSLQYAASFFMRSENNQLSEEIFVRYETNFSCDIKRIFSVISHKKMYHGTFSHEIKRKFLSIGHNNQFQANIYV